MGREKGLLVHKFLMVIEEDEMGKACSMMANIKMHTEF
jgi:hypothetical protein